MMGQYISDVTSTVRLCRNVIATRALQGRECNDRSNLVSYRIHEITTPAYAGAGCA